MQLISLGQPHAPKSRYPHFSDDDVFRILGRRAAHQTKRGPLSMSCLRKLFDAAKDPKHDELLRTFAKIEPAPNSRLKKRRSPRATALWD